MISISNYISESILSSTRAGKYSVIDKMLRNCIRWYRNRTTDSIADCFDEFVQIENNYTIITIGDTQSQRLYINGMKFFANITYKFNGQIYFDSCEFEDGTKLEFLHKDHMRLNRVAFFNCSMKNFSFLDRDTAPEYIIVDSCHMNSWKGIWCNEALYACDTNDIKCSANDLGSLKGKLEFFLPIGNLLKHLNPVARQIYFFDKFCNYGYFEQKLTTEKGMYAVCPKISNQDMEQFKGSFGALLSNVQAKRNNLSSWWYECDWGIPENTQQHDDVPYLVVHLQYANKESEHRSYSCLIYCISTGALFAMDSYENFDESKPFDYNLNKSLYLGRASLSEITPNGFYKTLIQGIN